MVRARVYQGRLEVQDPIPEEWEGQSVKIIPLTPDDPLPDLEARLAELRALGPMEFEPGEREVIAQLALAQDRISVATQGPTSRCRTGAVRMDGRW